MRKILLLVVLLVPAFAFAQNHVMEVTPFAGYQWGGVISEYETDVFNQDVEVRDHGSYGLLVNVPITYGFQFELLYNRQQTSLGTDADLFDPSHTVANIDIDYYHAGLLWQFAPSPSVRPYVTMSLGMANLELDLPNAQDEQKLSGSFGGGVKFMMNKNFGVRFEGRGYWTDTSDDDYYDCCYAKNLQPQNHDYDYYYSEDLFQGEMLVGVIFAF